MTPTLKCELPWSLDPDDLAAVPNARTLRALLRCVRTFPGLFPAHDHDDLGALLAPVLAQLRPALRQALQDHLGVPDPAAKAPDLGDLDRPALLQDRAIHTIVGEGVARLLPPFKPLVAAMLAWLDTYLAAHRHPTDGNLELLSTLLALSAAECELLRLATATGLGTIDRGHFAFISFGARLGRAIEAACGLRDRDARGLFTGNGALARSGLLQAISGRRLPNDLEDVLELSYLGDKLTAVALDSAREMAELVLSPLPAQPHGQVLHWPHLARQQALLCAALNGALAQRSRGINILLHGDPGTGKTAFACQVIAQIGANGYAIDHHNRWGDEASRNDRLANLRLSQCFAGHEQRSVLVLDEAEDVFQNDYQSPLSRVFGDHSESKSWINMLLESNEHPVIWISNRVDYLDPAYLRRFSLCIEFATTPLSLRRCIAESTLAAVGCTAATIAAVASNEQVSPALLSAAARLAELAQASGVAPDAAVTVHLDEHAKAQGLKAASLLARRTQRFDLRYLHFKGNVSPEGLLQALQRDPCAAMVFAGPPGTGKTQFAAEIAERLDRQLVVRTASDIHSKWFGQSEANVAGMFRTCDPATEVLLLDEADVLLGTRDAGVHSADRAVTAEFLRWLEVFEGTFICATNHVAEFDPALMRRFAFRVHFQPLSLQQRLALFTEQVLGTQPADGAAAPELDEATRRQLSQLDHLTPGDFANAGRRARRLGLNTHQWLDELVAEHEAKGPGVGTRRMGFV
jgi:SpoVK/Ycf46/Vps4 family AAA+-type ATPase